MITRQPKGIPTGGQFAATAHAEPAARLSSPADIHEQTHLALVTDSLTVNEEARMARDAVAESLTSGDFGTNEQIVRELVDDDRLLRLAIDRYVTTEDSEPGSFQPSATGHQLGTFLLDLQQEDIDDAVYGLKANEL